jgi:hypothetical protein
MKKLIVGSLFAVAAGSLLAADTKGDIEAAAKKLGDKSYSWTSSVETSGPAESSREGKTEKGGYSTLKFSARDTEYQAVFKGDKGVIKTGDSWQTIEALAESDDEENRRIRFTARRLQQFKPPHAEAQDLLKHVKELTKDEDGIYAGDLTPEGVKAVFGRGGFRRGGDSAEGPDTSGLKGRLKFWMKEGVLSKYSNHLEGSMKFGDHDVDIDRTTTVEIKDVGTTKVAAPEEAKKKLSS